MIQGCRYLRRSTDRWLLSKNSTTQLDGLESWHEAGLLWNCTIPITNSKGLYLYPCPNTTLSWPRLQHLLPKLMPRHQCPSCTRHQFVPSLHVFPNASSFKRETTLLPTDGVLPTAGIFTECFEQNFLPNGVFLPNSAHKSVSFLYQFLVLTHAP
jgi:hypothetical protein